MISNRRRWHFGLAVRLLVFSLIASVCFPALSEEEPPGEDRADSSDFFYSPSSPSGLTGPVETAFGGPEQRASEAASESVSLGLGDDLNLLDSVRKMAVALLLVVALLCIAVLLFKRFTRGTSLFPDQRVGRVVGRIYLNPKAILYLVKIADRVLVIGASPTSINLITEITDPEMVKEIVRTHPEPAAARTPFATYFRQFHGRFSGTKQANEEEATLEEHLRDIKDQMAKLKNLIGGSDNEEEL